MIHKVLWSELAQEMYLGTLEYYEQFSQSAAESLEAVVIALTDRLAAFKHLCPPAPNLPRYRKCVLTQDISVIYEVRGATIYIVAFLDNRADNLY
ncbi:MAG: type II toxin-antitoxin system RelE/ParE family toxin [Saprospiraceae bacterium]